MKHAWLIAGTDTEIGKTFVSCALLHAARAAGHTALGMKPVAAGVDDSGDNEDVTALIRASSHVAPRALVNPYLFEPAIAPHIAAADAGVSIEFATIEAAFADLQAQADVVLVEGVGGFVVPLGETQDTADLAVMLGLPVILVVGLRLGCINHALLTVEAITRRGLRLAGWVANAVDPDMRRQAENIAALSQRIAAPLLGTVPRLISGNPADASQYLRFPPERSPLAD